MSRHPRLCQRRSLRNHQRSNKSSQKRSGTTSLRCRITRLASRKKSYPCGGTTKVLSRAALPHMRKAGGGSIINVASTLGIVGARNRAAYAPSKGAVVLLTKSMAIDHGHENIRVNVICPGFVETDLTAAVIGQAPDPAAVRRERTAAHPIGRLGRPEDIASMAVYLVSDESSWVTGAVLPVDGGYLAV